MSWLKNPHRIKRFPNAGAWKNDFYLQTTTDAFVANLNIGTWAVAWQECAAPNGFITGLQTRIESGQGGGNSHTRDDSGLILHG